jgi:hypothetical protein
MRSLLKLMRHLFTAGKSCEELLEILMPASVSQAAFGLKPLTYQVVKFTHPEAITRHRNGKGSGQDRAKMSANGSMTHHKRRAQMVPSSCCSR